MMKWTPLCDDEFARLHTNLALLSKRKPEFAALVEDRLGAAKQIEIARKDGVVVGVRYSGEEGTRVLTPPENGLALIEEQRRAVQSSFEQGRRMAIVSGVGSAFILGAIQEALGRFRGAVLVFDRDAAHWAAALALNRILDDERLERLYLFGGEQADGDAYDFLMREHLFLYPPATFAFLLGVASAQGELAHTYISRAKALALRLRESAGPFDQRAGEFFQQAQKPLKRPPRSVWACTSRQAYIHYPLAAAFLAGYQRLGMSTRHTPFDGGFTAASRAVGEFMEFSPELIFSINALPSALLEDIGVRPEKIASIVLPRVCWLVDDVMMYQDKPESATPTRQDRIYCIDRTYVRPLLRSGARVSFLPPATQFQQPGRFQERYAAAISYIGSLPDVQAYMTGCSSYEKELIDRVEAARSRDHHKRFCEHLETMKPNSQARDALLAEARRFCATTQKGFTRDEAMLEYFLYAAATYTKRLRMVEALLPLGLRVFGPESWREALPVNYRERYGGFVENADLADAYASAKLSLNLHSHQCPTCLNPRDFDVPGAGGLVVGDWVADAERGLLEPGREMITFRQVDEAIELICYFLQDDDVREMVRHRGMTRAQQEHTYKHRAQAVLSEL